MPAVRSQFIRLMRDQEQALDAAWQGLADQLAAIFLRYAGADGRIPLDKWRQVRREISDLLTRFVLRQPDNAAYRILSGGTVFPLTPFFTILWDTQSEAMRLAVKEHADIMAQVVSDQIQGQLRRAFLDPFQRLNELPAEESAVLKVYQHPLAAKRDDGLMLEQRIPPAVADVIRRSTALFNTLVSDQMTAAEIGAEFRKYYAGSFRKPYVRPGMWGIGAGERLLRIARSEPIFAFSLASQAAGATNPFIALEVYVRRGRSVPCKVCDGVVAGNPYTLENIVLPGYHANCLCFIEYLIRRQAQWDTTVDPRWLQTAGALSPLLIQRLLRME